MSQNNNTTPKFIGVIEDVSIIGNLLKSIAFVSQVNISILPLGIQFTVEEGKYVQASVFLHRDVFEEYSIGTEDDICFQVSLPDILESLTFFFSESAKGITGTVSDTSQVSTQTFTQLRNKSKLKLILKSEHCPLELELEEKGFHTNVEIRIEPYDETLIEFDMTGSVMCKLILVSEHIMELFNEIDSNSPETLHIQIIPKKEILFECKGSIGTVSCSIPYNSETVQSFECNEQCSGTYKFLSIRHSFKAMNMSNPMSIKIDDEGVLCLAFLMPTRTESFVEFFCIPNVEEDDL